MALERKGVATATFVTHTFSSYAEGLCRMQKMQQLPLVVIGHPVAARPVDELREKVRAVHAAVRDALTGKR
jgi:hypothetical protein